MRTCPNCGQPNPEEDRFCVNCGADMMNIPTNGAVPPVASNPNYAATYPYNRGNQSILDNGIVHFALYFECIFASAIGLILALILSNTPFQGQKELSVKLIRCACISIVVWLAVGAFFFFLFFIGVFALIPLA